MEVVRTVVAIYCEIGHTRAAVVGGTALAAYLVFIVDGYDDIASEHLAVHHGLRRHQHIAIVVTVGYVRKRVSDLGHEAGTPHEEECQQAINAIAYLHFTVTLRPFLM